jgi:hypothetical protein
VSRRVELVIPYDIQRCLPNVLERLSFTRNGSFEAQRRKRDSRAMARLAWLQAGRPTLTPPVVVQVIVRRGRVVDPDSALSACKRIFDAVLCANRNGGEGIVPDDSARYVEYAPVLQTTGKPWAANPVIVLSIWEKEEPSDA